MKTYYHEYIKKNEIQPIQHSFMNHLEESFWITKQDVQDTNVESKISNLETEISTLQSNVSALESKISALENSFSFTSGSLLIFLIGVFCALWAQNTDRNAWLWFFLGIFFAPVTLLVLLTKNAADRKSNL